MTQLAFADRVQEIAQNVGGSTVVALLGVAAADLRTFADAGLDGKTVPYAIEHRITGQWEIGYGVYTAAGATLVRAVVLQNSEGTASLINFAGGVVDVWNDLPAEKCVAMDADSNHVTLPGGITVNGPIIATGPITAPGGITGPVAWSSITGTPTTIAGYGITDAYTKDESDARFAPIAVPWSSIINTPTTLAGYGITDAYTKVESDARYFTATETIPWANITGTPTTLAGYGITDAYTMAQADARFATTPVPWSNISGKPTTLAGYGITDAYTKAQTDAIFVPRTGPFQWQFVANTPTTIAGYGITDAWTKTESDARYLSSGEAIAWADITGTPTTIAGYGITDAYTKTESDARFAPIAVPWTAITGTPTTIAGYGITDAFTKTESDARYLSSGEAIAWADITGTPTTIAGYGITDAYTKTESDARFAPIAVPWLSITGKPTTLAGYGITDAFTKTESDARYLSSGEAIAWADITGTPTTLAGYGITDAYTKVESDARFAPIAVPWASITGTPTTLAGYGITDAYTKTQSDARYLQIGAAGAVLTFGAHLTGGSYDGSAPVTLATDATSANVPNTIVLRGPSGEFAAGSITVTGNLSVSGSISGGAGGGIGGALANKLTFGAHLTPVAGFYDNTAAVTLATDATSANTANAIIARGASGEFASGDINMRGVTFTLADSGTTGRLLVGDSGNGLWGMLRVASALNALTLNAITYSTGVEQPLTLQPVGAGVTIGPDPGGTFMLKVGGAAKIGGALSVNVGVKTASQSFATFGTTESNAIGLDISNVLNTTIRLQAVEFTVAYRDLSLNSSGGNVIVGVDPGGTDLLRVGGGLTLGGALSATQFIVKPETGKFAIQTAAGAVRFEITYFDSPGVMIQSYNLVPLHLNRLGNTVVVGVDPGAFSTEILRVGGGMYATGQGTFSYAAAGAGVLYLRNMSAAGATNVFTVYSRGGIIVSYLFANANDDFCIADGQGAASILINRATGVTSIRTTTVPVSNATLMVRGTASGSNQIEFGHANASGYASTIGTEFSSGAPFIAFNAEAGTTNNTYRTRGVIGTLIKPDLAGGIFFWRVPAATGDNQTAVNLGGVTSTGTWTVNTVGAAVTSYSAANAYQYIEVANVTGGILIGAEGSTGVMMSGAQAWDAVVRGNTNSGLSLGTANVMRMRLGLDGTASFQSYVYVNVSAGGFAIGGMANVRRLTSLDANSFGFLSDANGWAGVKGAWFDAASDLRVSGTTVISKSGTGYTLVHAPDGTYALYLGGSDPGNYYDNNTHYFRGKGGSPVFGTWNSSGLSITGGLTISASVSAQASLYVTGSVVTDEFSMRTASQMNFRNQAGTLCAYMVNATGYFYFNYGAVVQGVNGGVNFRIVGNQTTNARLRFVNYDGVVAITTVDATEAAYVNMDFTAAGYQFNNGPVIIVPAAGFVMSTPWTPAGGSGGGVKGTVAWDANYIYVCVATNSWRRATLAAF